MDFMTLLACITGASCIAISSFKTSFPFYPYLDYGMDGGYEVFSFLHIHLIWVKKKNKKILYGPLEFDIYIWYKG